MKGWSENLKPRKPSIVGIGAQKAGTTWLHDNLGQHPKIWVPPFKETHFFDHLYKEENRSWTPWHINSAAKKLMQRYERRGETMPDALVEYLNRLTSNDKFTRKWYRDVFAPAPAGTRPMDITPEFSGLPDEGVDFIAKFLPQAQFIYILRHPVDRIISQLKMNLMRQKRRPASVDEWMTEIDAPVLYQRGDYLQFVPRWRARFARDRLLFLPFGLISRNPRDFLRRCEEFLDLPGYEYKGVEQKVFAAPPGLSVPDSVRAEIRRRVEDQFTFLSDEFDSEFNAFLR